MSWRFETRTLRGPAATWWIGAAGVAAAAAAGMYWLDPERGTARRRRTADRTIHLAHLIRTRASRRIRYVTLSTANRLRHGIVDGPPTPAEGPMLLDRVESELFTDPRIPHGRLSFDVEGMTVVLRGAVDSDPDIDYIEAAVRRIPGVYNVRNFLHVAGTAAPNKLDALAASAGVGAVHAEEWPEEAPPDVDSEAAPPPAEVGGRAGWTSA